MHGYEFFHGGAGKHFNFFQLPEDLVFNSFIGFYIKRLRGFIAGDRADMSVRFSFYRNAVCDLVILNVTVDTGLDNAVLFSASL